MLGTSVGRPECVACATGPDVLDWRRLGTALGAAKLPPKKKPDTVDAWVALSAVKHGSAVVFTSDPGDIEAYLALMHPVDVHIVPVCPGTRVRRGKQHTPRRARAARRPNPAARTNPSPA